MRNTDKRVGCQIVSAIGGWNGEDDANRRGDVNVSCRVFPGRAVVDKLAGRIDRRQAV